MSLLSTSFQRPLTEGKYIGTITEITETEAHTTIEGKKVNAFVTLNIVLDDGRTYNPNLFEKSLRYAVLNVANQRGIISMVLPDAYTVLKDAHVKFSIVKNVVENEVYYNPDFREWDTEESTATSIPEFEVAR